MKKIEFDDKLNKPSLAFQPLYKQVEEHVKQLIIERRWNPGEALPNEFQLAEELGVSQGTVRKALNGLTAAKILTRQQGVGTFVSEHNTQQSLYRFFPLIADGKHPELPAATLVSLAIEKVSPIVLKQLGLSEKDKVIHLVRQRLLDSQVCIHESIFLPYKYFESLMNETELPHTLYHYYQQSFNLTVQKTQDSIKAVLADAETARFLDIAEGDPLLEVQRVTQTIDDKIIEYRVSKCLSDKYHYFVELS
ncbi:GntR family transcriptional regulator [Glaciecola petra]|uniref:GntR family transcriptional regulator n=1 Tax=Glaciecola petra TaxID=3075602 RepID=A0ABU2ZRB5_9ALTE|nr:GntR family transcriptional regulator [Aestuariibacter sp. P117]MDT0595172.1 GntR family transcriptional regulator [Aestuariibacter sp. P117]